MARAGGATVIDLGKESVVERLNDMTGGKGPEKCIDAVGMEAHGTTALTAAYDRVKQAVMAESDRPHVLREIAYVCRPAGTLSVPGVYGGLIDKFPMGMIMNKGLTIRTAQTHVNRWTDDLLRRIEEGQLDPSFVITHDGPAGAGPRDVPDVPRQAGRLRQGRPQALGLTRCAPIPAGTAGPTRPPTRSRAAWAGSRSRSAWPRSRPRTGSPARSAWTATSRSSSPTACGRW